MIFLAIELSGAMPAPRNPLQAKGALAWENAKAEGGLRPVNRLLVRAVDDKTNVVYERAVRRFLGEVRRHGFPFHDHAARDETMARHLEQLCYGDEKGFHEGSNCFFGFIHIFGDHKDRMPLSARALQAWSRLIQQAEGMPLCRESVGAIALQMLRQGRLAGFSGAELRRSGRAVVPPEEASAAERSRTGWRGRALLSVGRAGAWLVADGLSALSEYLAGALSVMLGPPPPWVPDSEAEEAAELEQALRGDEEDSSDVEVLLQLGRPEVKAYAIDEMIIWGAQADPGLLKAAAEDHRQATGGVKAFLQFKEVVKASQVVAATPGAAAAPTGAAGTDAAKLSGPPHNLRHSGAACFVESGGALEQARRRGRWASPGSVQRYTKTHFLVRHRARVPPPVLAEGSQFWRSPARSFLKALRMGAAAETYLGKQLVKGIDVIKVDGELKNIDAGKGEIIKRKNKRDFNEGQNDFIDAGKSDFINDVGKIFKRKGEGDFIVTGNSSWHESIDGDAVHSQGHPGPEVEPLPSGPVAGLKREMQRTTGDVHEPPSTETQRRQGSIRKKRAARARGAAPVRG